MLGRRDHRQALKHVLVKLVAGPAELPAALGLVHDPGGSDALSG
jgi:hypothetical protein